MITKFGKRFITTNLAGLVNFNSQDLAFGISSTTPDVNGNDTKLGFEFYRVNSIYSTTNIITDGVGNTSYGVIYTSTIPSNVSGIINEIALYPRSGAENQNTDNRFLSDFENINLWTDSDGFTPLSVTSPSPRIGDSMMQIQAIQGSENEYFLDVDTFDILNYNSVDSVCLAYYQGNTYVDKIKIKFYSSETDYQYVEFDCSTQSAGEYISTKYISELQSYGSPTSTVIKIGVSVLAKSGSNSGTVYFDGLRINDEDNFNPVFGMIARSLITYSATVSGVSGQNTITVPINSSIFIGQKVTGTGIGSNAKITAIDGNTVTLSVNNTTTVSGVATFYGIKKIAGRPVDIEYRLGLGF